ncbi:hypothetical protein BU15DRAFT_60512 [Melanogaster broomeanus]|nr:hypothetical protein BU15DRAFT_60512 [Melanogaster broomeanus]
MGTDTEVEKKRVKEEAKKRAEDKARKRAMEVAWKKAEEMAKARAEEEARRQAEEVVKSQTPVAESSKGKGRAILEGSLELPVCSACEAARMGPSWVLLASPGGTTVPLDVSKASTSAGPTLDRVGAIPGGSSSMYHMVRGGGHKLATIPSMLMGDCLGAVLPDTLALVDGDGFATPGTWSSP